MLLVNVHVRYGRKGPWILHGLDAELNAGDTVVLTGRNGSGKSTLLRTMAGLLPISAGEIRDRPERVAWTPDAFPFEQPFTAWSYLETTAVLRGVPDASKEITRLAERLALEPFFDTELAELSKGNVRKVALVQALLARPGLLVADEPWDGLDVESQTEVLTLLNDVAYAGGICVLTDHNGRYGRRLRGVRHWELIDGAVSETQSTSMRETR